MSPMRSGLAGALIALPAFAFSAFGPVFGSTSPPPEDEMVKQEGVPGEIRTQPIVSEIPQPVIERAGGTIMDRLVRDNSFSALTEAIRAAGMEVALAAPGPFTLLAPTNAAFDQMPRQTRAALLMPDAKPVLSHILSHHILVGRVDSNELTQRIRAGGGKSQLNTLSGQTLTAELVGDDIFLTDSNGNRARVTGRDKSQVNGVIHVIDSLLHPQPRK